MDCYLVGVTEKITEMKWIRTCQQCGNKQEDKKPEGEPASTWLDRKCKSCKSAELDYGSWKDD